MGMAFPLVALAQTDPKVEPLKLSPRAEHVLATLKAATDLPAEDWKVHAGDLPHGEAPDLDDSAWPIVKAPYVTETGAVWFRRTIVVPKTLGGYATSGASITFTFNIWTPGPAPIIVYFDGRRVAMGEALEPRTT
jgi:alpha-mannosidase